MGRNPLIREKKDDCVGGGRFRMDLPGIGIVLAELEGTGEGAGEAMCCSDKV